MKSVLYYTNQFFGHIGGEDHAGIPPLVQAGAVGPAVLIGETLNAKVEATIICGDNYSAEHMDELRLFVRSEAERIKPDIFIAGPAFNAGRFGVACGDLCAFVGDTLGIPAVTGMYPENPAVELYRAKAYIIETGKSAAGMKKAAEEMAGFSNKLLRGEKIGLPSEEGLIPKGIRVNVFKEKTGAERAVDMLLNKLAGRPFKSEVPIPVYKSVTPAKGIADLKKAKIAILTSGGIVPKGNPDRMPAATAKFFKAYSIVDIDKLAPGEFESAHAGYDPVYANQNPNRIVPVDLIKELCDKGEIGRLYGKLITTTGNSTSVADATRMGREIAEMLKNEQIDGAILTST